MPLGGRQLLRLDVPNSQMNSIKVSVSTMQKQDLPVGARLTGQGVCQVKWDLIVQLISAIILATAYVNSEKKDVDSYLHRQQIRDCIWIPIGSPPKSAILQTVILCKHFV